jgi:YVTN family beta-propeller protein
MSARPHVRTFLTPAAALILCLPLASCRKSDFPTFADNYREYAYVANGSGNSVTVFDLVNNRRDREIPVGHQPTGLAINPVTNEIYVVNTQPYAEGSVSVIDAYNGRVDATIPVHRLPYFIEVAPDGRRAYVPSSGSNTVSVIDLKRRRVIFTAGAGEAPGLARIAPDMRSLVVTNRASGSVSIFDVDNTSDARPLKLRATFSGCPGATDAVILPDSSKAFIACSATNKLMAIQLASQPGSWPARQDSTSLTDHLLTLLDVGKTPVQLALKPDGGELFSMNFDSDSISEVSTWTNEVTGTYTIGAHPVFGLVAPDDSTLWISNFGADTLTEYSIDDGKVVAVLHTGSAPDSLALSAEGHLLLAVDARSGDVSVIRTQEKHGPALFDLWHSGADPRSIVVKAFNVGR